MKAALHSVKQQTLNRSSLSRKLRRTILRWHRRPRSFDGYNKVFCIGWLKTGTTSFGDAMRRLGFKHCGWDRDVFRNWYERGHIDRVLRYARHFESFDDLPWNATDMYRLLDKSFPNSKFVLLIRESDSWFVSYQAYRARHGKTEALDREEAIAAYEQRNAEIQRYFAEKGIDRLLVMDVTGGDGFDVLCPFLGLPVLDEPFPHSNKQIYNTALAGS